ncbi:VCBS domain-containing protein, partial [Rhodobacteraceae bacterium]|nr:VCBS domain-containing protein [Paracoccaceae bacterium]
DDFDWSDGYEITYYDGAGKTLGRKIVDIFVDQGGIAGQAGGVTANQGGSSGSSETTFVVTQVGGKFLIDGVSQKELTLDEGKTYKFDLSSTTLSTHPFKLGAGGSEYTHGTDGSTIVTSGTQATSGAYLEVTLSPSAPSALNYYCSAHSGMGAAISTNDAQINVQYVDKDWNWIGDSFDDGNFSRSFIKVSKDDGSKVEISVDGNRSSLYNFNDEDVFQGGTEIEGGLTYTISSNWVREGGKMDTSALNALKVTGSVLDGVPSSLTFDDSGTETAYRDLTYEDTNYGGKEYTYFDSTGAKLGHSFEFTDSWSGEKVTDFNDKDYNWLGNVRVKTGEYKNVYSRSEDQTAGTSTEVNARYTWDSGNSAWVESESSTYIFNLNNGNLIEGTETRGGITTEYGANWAVEKSSANVSALTEISATDLAEHLGNSNVALEDLYNFTATVNGSEVTKGYKSEQSFSDPYSGGGTNVDTTYYNAAGEEIGKSNSYSGSYGSGANFQDVDYKHLGDYNEQGTWSNSFFKIPTTDSGGNVTGKTEYQVEKDTGSNGFTREFVEVFDANGNFVSGTETENGLTKDITVDSNGFRVVSAAALPESELAALAVTDATVLAEIPTSFVFDVSGTDTAYVKLTRDDSAGSQMTGGGKEYTYFNAQGTEIGKAFEFQNWDGAKVTDFNTVDYHFLGSVRVKTDDYKEIRFEETKDVSGTQRFVETFTEYTWDTSASPAAWKVTRSEESIYTDEPYEGGTLISRVEERDGQKFTFDDTGAMTGSEFTGDINTVPNLSNPALLAALPSQWANLGTIKATFETTPGADTSLWNVSDYYTFYATPVNGGSAVIVGYANLNADYEDATKPQDGYSETSMTFFDKDEVTVIGGASENASFQTSYFYTPGANNTYTYTDKTITFGPNGTIADQSKTTDNYINATGEISGGTYNGGSYTSMGFTEFYNADGDVTDTNYAPTSEINNIAPSSTPSRGILPEEDELTLETYAGNVTESNSAVTSTVTGAIATADADGETLSLKLMGGTTSGNEQTLDGQFGNLVLNANGTYEYELDNAKSELDGLNDGDIETDGFTVEVKDAYHTTYQMLDFEILGKNEPGAGQGSGNNNASPLSISMDDTFVYENAAGDIVGTLSANSSGVTYTLQPYDTDFNHAYDVDKFTLGSDGKTIKLKPGVSLDYETQDTYKLKVLADDGTTTALKDIVINVIDVNEGSGSGNNGTNLTISVDDTSVYENVIGDTVGTLSANSSGVTYTLQPYDTDFNHANDVDKFTLGSDGKTIKLKPGVSLDYETQDTYKLKVLADDGTTTAIKEIVINVLDVSEGPAPGENTKPIITLSDVSSIKENETFAVAAKVSARDAEDGSVAVSLTGSGRDDNKFIIVNNELRIKSSADYEAQDTYRVQLSAQDSEGLTTLRNLDIKVTDAPELMKGKIVDGYVAGATIFQDLNNNNILDANEPFTVTSATGEFTLDGIVASKTAALKMISGFDIGTNKPIVTSLGVPTTAAGDVVASPLGTIASLAQAQDTDAGLNTVVERVASYFTVSETSLANIDIINDDPLQALKSSDSDVVAAARDVFEA